jgi:hypothetical protein
MPRWTTAKWATGRKETVEGDEDPRSRGISTMHDGRRGLRTGHD